MKATANADTVVTEGKMVTHELPEAPHKDEVLHPACVRVVGRLSGTQSARHSIPRQFALHYEVLLAEVQ